MDVNPSPVTHPFEVWFVPAVGASLRLSAPLHLGQPLAAHDDAVNLAEVAAAELPAYGFPRGEVRIMRDASVVQALPTVHRSIAHPAPSASHKGEAQPRAAGSQRAVARMALEDLRQQVSRARPNQPAPPAWIACLDQALRVIASPDGQRRLRLDGQPGVTVDTLHQRVIAALHQCDQPSTAPVAFSPALDGELSLTG